MSNTANSRVYKAPVTIELTVPGALSLSNPEITVKRTVYFRRSNDTPYVVVRGRRVSVTRMGKRSFRYREVLQRADYNAHA